MQFPVYFYVFGMRIHPHPVMEGIAYAVGLSLHLMIKARIGPSGGRGGDLAAQRTLWEIAGAIVGALVGARLLAFAENWRELVALPHLGAGGVGLEQWLGGKTIVGGLIGGWMGVEIAKRCLGIRRRTGDAWVYPLLAAMAIGRIGCFLTGLSDDTYGNHTRLPWGVDFGDGPRHPTQLYDILALGVMAGILAVYQRRGRLGWNTGKLFRAFMAMYGAWRFFVEFLKPTDKEYLGLSAIQIASLGLCVFSVWSWRRASAAMPSGTAAVAGAQAMAGGG